MDTTGHHATPAWYVETKLERIVRHFDQVIGVSVLLSVDNHKEKDRRQYAEINLHLKGKDIFVEAHHETCMRRSTHWSTSWTVRSSGTRTACRATTGNP